MCTSEFTQVTLSIIFLVGVAVLKTQITAALFSAGKFPTAYSFWTCVVTCVMLIPFFLLRMIPALKERLPKKIKWDVPSFANEGQIKNLALIVLFTALDLTFTNIALANISTALQQCIASTNPFWTICIETILYRKGQHILIYLVIAFIVVGAAFAAVSDFEGIDAFGLVSACIAVLCSSTKYVFTHSAFKQFKDQMGPLALLFWIDLLMAPITAIWAGVNGELVTMFATLVEKPDMWGSFTFTAALGGVRALTQYIVLVQVTATSMSTANIFTQILNILIALINPDAPHRPDITPLLIIGVCLVIIFCVVYTLLKIYKNVLPAIDKVFGWTECWWVEKPKEEPPPKV